MRRQTLIAERGTARKLRSALTRISPPSWSARPSERKRVAGWRQRRPSSSARRRSRPTAPGAPGERWRRRKQSTSPGRLRRH